MEDDIKKVVCLILITGVVSFTGCAFPSKSSLSRMESARGEEDTQRLIELEKGALNRWYKGDPTGFLELYAEDYTYFDETTEARVDGLDAMEELYAPLAGKIYSARYEMLNPKVQWFARTGILTFGLVAYSEEGNVVSRWNSTEVYSECHGKWKIVHSHWSFAKHNE